MNFIFCPHGIVFFFYMVESSNSNVSDGRMEPIDLDFKNILFSFMLNLNWGMNFFLQFTLVLNKGKAIVLDYFFSNPYQVI